MTKAFPNYPNPFVPSRNTVTYLTYEISQPTDVTIYIYNLLGERIREFHLGYKKPGYYDDQFDKPPIGYAASSQAWDGKDNRGFPVPTGVYIYRVVTSTNSTLQKIMLIR